MTHRYQKFENKFIAIAISIASQKNNRSSVISGYDLARHAIDDVFLNKRNKYNPQMKAKLKSFFYILLRNSIIDHLKIYDKGHYRNDTDDSAASSVIIESNSRIVGIDPTLLDDETNLDYSETEGPYMVCEDPILPSSEFCVDNYDEKSCLIYSLLRALSEMSNKDRLILTCYQDNYEPVSIKQKRDYHSLKEFYDCYSEVCGNKKLSNEQIAKILNMTAGAVRTKRASLRSMIALEMLSTFEKIYLGAEPRKTFVRMLSRGKSGKTVVEKLKLNI